jgi:diguanylate cyclase (GGDEF)-like protein
MLAEAAVLPLAALVVFIYHPEQPVRFGLLGATFLVINYAFNRISATSAVLRKRVAELETLSKTSRGLAASLQTHELVRALARETMAAIPEAETLVLVQRGDSEALRVDYFERNSGRFERADGPRDVGATRWVLEHGEALYLANRRHPVHDIALQDDTGIRSWLGVPLLIHGNTEGVLIVESRANDVFDRDDSTLLEAIASQAAVALQNAQLYELAMVDGLTRLFVRRYFDARLDEEIERTKRFETEFSVIMMDIDNFKQLNDTYGHLVGDRALRAIAAIVKEQMRGVDTAARYGGEEFGIVLPRTPMVDAYNLAERIREEIAELVIPTDDGTVSVTASMGIASFPESGATDSEGLVRLADRALYRAKKTGKNRVELYWTEDDESRRGSLRPA